MEQAEIEKLIGELEIAVDRLRSLYEQYFMGIEKLEPGVPRKDVERRIQVLRKVQLRNTAMRFRFQMVLQRFNTYQTHWQRICREIENGTYKRHLLKAHRRFGSSIPPAAPSVPLPPVRPEAGAPLPKELAAQLAELDADFAPADLSVDESPETPVHAPPAPPRPGAQARRSVPPLPLAIAATGRVMPGSLPAAAPKPTRVHGPVWRKLGATGGSGGAGSPGTPALPAPSSQAARPPALPAAASGTSLAIAAPVARLPAPAAPRVAVAAPVGAGSTGPSGPAAAAGQGLPEERMRQIYAQYVDTKRKQNESTATITYQAVAKSLKESGEKLRQKHGKSVDFEVAVKDGKTILKPVVKA